MSDVPTEFENRFLTMARLEPRSRSEEATQLGLEARIADPLWMLARQWQMGEFLAEDNGSPVRVQVEYRIDPIDEVKLVNAGSPVNIEGAPPLETYVERERIQLNYRVRVQIGQQFERFLRRALHDQSAANKAICAFRRLGNLGLTLPINFSDDNDDLSDIDGATERFIRLMQGRAIDGKKLFNGDKIMDAQKLLDISPDVSLDRAKLQTALDDLEKWYVEVYNQPSLAEETAWKPQDLEYEFTLHQHSKTADSNKKEEQVALVAPDYKNGDLDWYSCDLLRIAKQKKEPIQINSINASFNPTRIGFAGKPNERWWEMEDYNVDLAKLNPNTTDLSKLLLMEFALVYADDWYQFPLEIPRGTLTKITKLQIRNVFGEEVEIDPAIDPGATESDRWEIFTLANYSDPNSTSSAFLFIPPTLGDREESPAIEDVRLIRDEGANMVFAIEKTVQNGLGKPIEGYDAQMERYFRQQKLDIESKLFQIKEQLAADGLSEEEQRKLLAQTEEMKQLKELLGGARVTTKQDDKYPSYKIASTVPDNWIPYVPVKVPSKKAARKKAGVKNANEHSIRLRRANMLRNNGNDGVTPMTRILENPAAPDQSVIWLNEESVTRMGTNVLLARQRIRWVDGSTYIWWGRKVKTGRGEGSSGLRFDYLESDPH